jgi:hypothetical protein
LIVPAIQPSQQAVQLPQSRAGVTGCTEAGADAAVSGITLPQHFLNFSPLPHGQGSLRPGFMGKRAALRRVYRGCASGAAKFLSNVLTGRTQVYISVHHHDKIQRVIASSLPW